MSPREFKASYANHLLKDALRTGVFTDISVSVPGQGIGRLPIVVAPLAHGLWEVASYKTSWHTPHPSDKLYIRMIEATSFFPSPSGLESSDKTVKRIVFINEQLASCPLCPADEFSTMLATMGPNGTAGLKAVVLTFNKDFERAMFSFVLPLQGDLDKSGATGFSVLSLDLTGELIWANYTSLQKADTLAAALGLADEQAIEACESFGISLYSAELLHGDLRNFTQALARDTGDYLKLFGRRISNHFKRHSG